MTSRMREIICDDLDITKEGIAKILKKEGLTYRDNTLDIVFGDVGRIVTLLRERKLLK